jgi:DHA1 family bicyclomycin/chloramphenicol resistance-like MFS transporter
VHAPRSTDTGDARRFEGTPWRLLLLLMAMTAIGPMSLNILVPSLPKLAATFATDTGTVQLTVSLYLVGFASAQLIIGPLSDRFGRRPVVLAGLSIMVLASATAMAASSVGALIAIRVVQAIGASAGVVIGRAIIRDLFTRDRAASMIGLVATVMVVAPMVAPLIGGTLDTLLSWEAIFTFLTLVGAIVLGWAVLALPETRVHDPANHDGSFFTQTRRLIASGSFVGYVLCAALGSAPFFIFIGGAPHVVVSIMGRTSAEYGLWFIVTSFGYMLGNFSASRLAVRRGVDALIWWGILIEIVGAIVTAIAILLWPNGGPATIFLPQVIVSFGNGMLLPNSIAGAVSVRPQSAGTASGITGFTQMGLGAVAAQLMGYVLAHATTALPMAFVTFASCAAAAVAYLLLIRRRRDRVLGGHSDKTTM